LVVLQRLLSHSRLLCVVDVWLTPGTGDSSEPTRGSSVVRYPFRVGRASGATTRKAVVHPVPGVEIEPGRPPGYPVTAACGPSVALGLPFDGVAWFNAMTGHRKGRFRASIPGRGQRHGCCEQWPCVSACASSRSCSASRRAPSPSGNRPTRPADLDLTCRPCSTPHSSAPTPPLAPGSLHQLPSAVV